MKKVITIFILQLIVNLSFGQAKTIGISNKFREISVLDDTIKLLVPKYIKYPCIKFYSNTIIFDTSIESHNKRDYFSIKIHDFRRYKKIPDTSIEKKVNIILRTEQENKFISKKILTINNVDIAFLKFKRQAIKRQKEIAGIITFFLPDSRSVDINIDLLYSQKNLKILDYMFNSFTLIGAEQPQK